MWIRTLYYARKVLQNWSYGKEEIIDLQEKRAENIVDEALKLPFYSDRWGIDSLEGLGNLENLTPVSGEMMRDQGELDTVLREDSGISRQTSGTGGTPMRVRFTEQARDYLSGVELRRFYQQDYTPTKRILRFGRDEERSWIGNLMIPKKFVGPEASLEEQVESLESYSPYALYYFPQMLLSLCKYISRTENECGGVEKVFTCGEVPTPSMRDYIEETLGAEVYDHYATTEFGTVAWESGCGGYHVAEDSVYAQVCDYKGAEVEESEEGQLVLTGLVNPATPLVRYAIGDIVETGGSCSCDTSFKRIERIRGRIEDVFRNSEGETVYPDQVLEIISPVEDILFFQFVAGEDSYTLKYVPNRGFERENAEKCAERLRSELSIEPLELEEAEKIPRSRGGKLEVIRNEQKVPKREILDG